MTDGFKDKVALVTGGSSGIGRATSLAFARQGARVAIADREPTGAAQTARMIEDAGGSAAVFEVDVTRANDVASVIDRIVQTYRRLDCAFNNAGIGGEVANTADYPEEIAEAVVWLCSDAASFVTGHTMTPTAATWPNSHTKARQSPIAKPP